MKISFEWLLLLILSTVVAIGIGAAFYRLCQHYRFPYLLSYFLFAAVWNVFGIYGLIYVILVPQVVPPGIYVFVYLLNYFLIVPMILALVYFFWGFVVRLVEKSIHRAFKLGFGILVFLFCAFFVISVFHILARPGAPSLDSLYLSIPILRIFKDLFIYGALVYLFLNLKRLDSPVKRKHFKVLGIVLVLGHTLAEICLMGFLPVSHPFINTVITTAILILKHRQDRMVAIYSPSKPRIRSIPFLIPLCARFFISRGILFS